MIRKVLERAILDADNIASKLRMEYDTILKNKTKNLGNILITNFPRKVKNKKKKHQSKLVEILHTKPIKNRELSKYKDINTLTKDTEVNLTRLGIDVYDFKKNSYNMYDYNSVFITPHSQIKRPNTAPQTIMELVYHHSHITGKIKL